MCDDKTSWAISHLTKTIEKLERKLEDTNENLNKVSATLVNYKILQEKISALEERVENLEKLRWWVGTLIVGGLLTALFRLVFK